MNLKSYFTIFILLLSCLNLHADELSIEQRLDKLESAGQGFPKWLKLGGEWELEYLDAERDANQDASANPQGRFQHDKFLLKPKIIFSDHIYMVGELEFGVNGAQLEEYHIHYTALPFGTFVKIGLDERFSKADKKFDMADRKTETYPLIGTSFWRDEQFALTLGGKQKFGSKFFKDVFWRLTYGDGLELHEKQPSENKTYLLTHDNDQAQDDVKTKKEWGAGLGVTFQAHERYTFDIAAWHISSELNHDERTRLSNITGYTTLDTSAVADIKTHQTRSGIRTTHKILGATLTFEHAIAKDGLLRRKGSYGQLSYKFNLGGTYFHSIEPLGQGREVLH